MIKVFDLDGTLLDSNSIWRKIDEEFVRRRGLTLTPEYMQFVSHAIFPAAATFTKEYYHLPDSEQSIMDEWYAMAENAYTNELPLKPYVKEYLDLCEQNGDRMVVYTSSVPELCRAALERHGILGYFEEIYFAQELMLEKKHTASFLAVTKLLNADSQSCILYDDSPHACKSAREAGWHVVGIRDELFEDYSAEMEQICHRVISGFQELI